MFAWCLEWCMLPGYNGLRGRRGPAVCAAAEGGASRRRSQRLKQQGRPSTRSLEKELLQREARFAEQQQQLQQQQIGISGISGPDAADLQEQAARNLLADLGKAKEGVEPEPTSSPASSMPSDGTVEADYIMEQQRQPSVQQKGTLPSEISRQSQLLLEILQAGEQVEEVIAKHRTEVDGKMLQLLERRIEAATRLEKQAHVVQGLQLLYRRLKAEVDRQQASPALQLLDELIGILDPNEGDMASSAVQEQRRQQAMAHMRAAFSGGFVGEADVLSLAEKLSSAAGTQLADQLLAEPVDPMAFLAESTELLNRVQEQESQLEQYIQMSKSPEQAAEAEQLLQQRRGTADLVQQCVVMAQKFVQVEAFMFGSVPLRAVLPDGDIDISVFTTAPLANGDMAAHGTPGGGELRDTWASQLLRALEREASSPDAPFKIRDVQIIQAEVKLVKCVVSDVVVDVSFDTVGGLCTVAFLEAADRRIGKQHLFKRSILLLKAWCYYESRLLGAHHGLISSYALEVLVLYIFNLHHTHLNTPLDVLRRFLSVLGSFDWEHYCLALQGHLPLSQLHSQAVPTAELPSDTLPLLDDEFMREVLQRYSVQHPLPAAACPVPTAPQPLLSPNFPLKHLNIVDPLLPSNNLGRSVSKASFARVKKALALGSRSLEEALLKDPCSAVEAVDQFFRNTWRSPVRMAADNQTFLSRLSTTQLPPSAIEAVVVAAAAAGFSLSGSSSTPTSISNLNISHSAPPGASLGGSLPAAMRSGVPLRPRADAAEASGAAQKPADAQMAMLNLLLSDLNMPSRQQANSSAYHQSAMLQQKQQQQQQQPAAQMSIQVKGQGIPRSPFVPSKLSNAESSSSGAVGTDIQQQAAMSLLLAQTTGSAAGESGSRRRPTVLAMEVPPLGALGVLPRSSSVGAQPLDAAEQPHAQPQAQPHALQLRQKQALQMLHQQEESFNTLPEGWQSWHPGLPRPTMVFPAAAAAPGIAATAPNTPVAAAAGKQPAVQPAAVSLIGQGQAGIQASSSSGQQWIQTAAASAASVPRGSSTMQPASTLPGMRNVLPNMPAIVSGHGVRQDLLHGFFTGDLQAMERNLLVARRRQKHQQQQRPMPQGVPSASEVGPLPPQLPAAGAGGREGPQRQPASSMPSGAEGAPAQAAPPSLVPTVSAAPAPQETGTADAQGAAPAEASSASSAGHDLVAAMAVLPAVRTSMPVAVPASGQPVQQQLNTLPSPRPAAAVQQEPSFPLVPRGPGSEDGRSPKTFAAALRSSSRTSSSTSLASPGGAGIRVAAGASLGSSPGKSASGNSTPGTVAGAGRRPAWGRGSSSNLAAMASTQAGSAATTTAVAATQQPPPPQRSWSAVAAGKSEPSAKSLLGGT